MILTQEWNRAASTNSIIFGLPQHQASYITFILGLQITWFQVLWLIHTQDINFQPLKHSFSSTTKQGSKHKNIHFRFSNTQGTKMLITFILGLQSTYFQILRHTHMQSFHFQPWEQDFNTTTKQGSKHKDIYFRFPSTQDTTMFITFTPQLQIIPNHFSMFHYFLSLILQPLKSIKSLFTYGSRT